MVTVMQSNLRKVVASGERGTLGNNGKKAPSGLARTATKREDILGEHTFRAMLARERRRAERSRQPFILMLLDGSALETSRDLAERLSSIVSAVIRQSDLI